MNPVSTASRQLSRASGVGEPSQRLPQVVSLSNGKYQLRLSDAGSGFSQCNGVAISRWTADETRDADGLYIYLRDLDDGSVWSAGFQPTRVAAAQYDFQYCDGVAEILRVDDNIACKLAICVSPSNDFEIRCCQLTNLGDRPRRIELTSYVEWVLGSRDADNSHPAFSKLFVETQFCAERQAVLARRRPRHADDSEFWGFHSIVCQQAVLETLEFETNRARFIGRGRTLANPTAMDANAKLSGDSGPVLDPIGSLRVAVLLDPGESQQVAFALGGGSTRERIDELLAMIGESAEVERVFENVKSAATTVEGNGWTTGDELSAAVPRRVIIHPSHRGEACATTRGEAERLSVPDTIVRSKKLAAPVTDTPDLLFDNGYGGFAADGREYVIRLRADGKGGHQRPPAPWANVIANERAGFLITEAGAGYTWSGNSRENRLTYWHNDPISDSHSEIIWIRDEDAGVFWSPTPGPTPAAAEYRVRHGFGYTTFEHQSHDLSQELTAFMDRDEPVKLSRLRLTNRSKRVRRLSLYSYVHLALAAKPGVSASAVTTTVDAENRTIWATHPHRDRYGECAAFSAVRSNNSMIADVSYSCDRGTFLGKYGDSEAPAALATQERLDGRQGTGLDPCAAWQVKVELPPGESFDCTFLLGESESRDVAAQLISRLETSQQIDQALENAQAFWHHVLPAITIETPNREIDLMVNGWLVYQNMSCRLWGRSAYYQPGGAYGFRDQLQDSAALIYHRPELTRTQILRHAAQQFVEGDVLHWWHPDTGYGLRTRFSDDLLWLPYAAAEYVQKTGDAAILDEPLPFITAAPLADGEQEAFLRPGPSEVVGTLYQHCCRALERGLTRGANGLPLIGCGDWNDGFSRVGHDGKGESVWLGFFIDHVLENFLPICTERGDDARIEELTTYREQLREALNTTGWDGGWYRRAYYDNGQPLGSTNSDECRIDTLAQAWAILSGVAPAERAQMAVDAVESRLIDDEAGMIRLLTPAFDKTPNDPGYIKGYLPGIRENGGQYTHGVLWMIRAMAEMGRGSRAVELLQMLTPVWHAKSQSEADVYKTEPYVVAADVYGEPPHVGRGGWTWYTGSAGWMFRVAVESIFGFTTERGDTLVINPSISSEWPECRLTYRLPDGKTCYEVTIENPSGRERGVQNATLDGITVTIEGGAARVPLERDGNAHRVVVRL